VSRATVQVLRARIRTPASGRKVRPMIRLVLDNVPDATLLTRGADWRRLVREGGGHCGDHEREQRQQQAARKHTWDLS